MNQKGTAVLIIFIIVAVIIGLGVVAYGYSLVNKNTAPAQTTQSPPKDPIKTLEKLGSPGCPDTDYTGCDTTGDFMTWTDNGIR